jgi:hypothetical protein
MYDAIAQAVDQGLAGARPFDQTLEAPPPELQALFAALRDNEEQTGRFLGTVAGAVPPAEFFAPDNVAAILGEQLAATANA